MGNVEILLDVVKVRTESVHMLPYLEKPPFVRLKDAPLFSKAYVAHGTVVWPGNIDMAPDTLYNRSVPSHSWQRECFNHAQTQLVYGGKA